MFQWTLTHCFVKKKKERERERDPETAMSENIFSPTDPGSELQVLATESISDEMVGFEIFVVSFQSDNGMYQQFLRCSTVVHVRFVCLHCNPSCF